MTNHNSINLNLIGIGLGETTLDFEGAWITFEKKVLGTAIVLDD